ncbi:hypothetical protein AB840_12655 [Megasphaera cerevisiae DSM 20462]|jgi:hypothetical protein|uniref:Uncharacterized protein n=1 Tax=Megasphaera cerevisiae DSM 20462 TaxID=1122219 RepID=A0A0J6WQD4_9FIRM|nr:hypothetical protein [Megasphaera cerevisiae]KMO85615.1 hypothetical protein AB840_12655 [Megasphaera cerevisiae DSM 20462]OKY52638.1 hypothetical protein BSR42_11725 [Megasphaera cerevisiae]SKA12825.1 hypothetical protein SAMN05660900_02520 [Megasphaera cerevisiae DSM 20462]
MKIRCVELSQFESELLISFMKQPKDVPVSAGLSRTIYRRLEGQPAFAKSRINVYEKNTGVVRTAMAEK